MADHSDDPLVHEFVGHRDGLLRIVLVIAPDDLDLLSEDTPLGVPLFHRDDGAVLEFLPECSLVTCQWAGYPELNRARRVGPGKRENDDCGNWSEPDSTPAHRLLIPIAEIGSADVWTPV